VIAINQDSLGVAGDLIYQRGPVQIWAGPLHDGSRAVVLFNRHTWVDPYATDITVSFQTLGFKKGTKAVVGDLYARKDLGTFVDSFTASILTHDVFVGKITPLNFEPQHLKWRPDVFWPRL